MEELWPLVDTAIEDQRLLLFVDGIDEWTTEEAGRAGCQMLQAFATTHQAAVVVTSRPYGYQKVSFGGLNWQVSELAPLSAEQRERLCNQWFSLKVRRDASQLRLTGDSPPEHALQEVSRFTAELSRSSDLLALSEVPLLLLLLIFMRFQRAILPRGRFEAYDRMLDHLLREHPAAKRVAASVTDSGGALDEISLRQALANLAFVVHEQFPEGTFTDAQVEAIVHDFLTDTSSVGLGLDPSDANKYRPQFSQIAEGTVGVLVRQGIRELSFIHRSFQEFLAAEHISRLPLQQQRELIQRHCTSPQWQETLLAVFWKTRRPEDLRFLIEQVEAHEDASAAGLAVRELLTEVGFGDFSCPPDVADRICLEAFARIELYFWMPHRQRMLALVLDGLRSTRLRERVRQRVRRWTFSRGLWPTWYEGVSQWPAEKHVLVALIGSLHSEDAHVQRAAGRALASLASGDEATGSTVAALASRAPSPLVRAAAVESLQLGWPTDPAVRDAVSDARNSISPELRIAAIAARVRQGSQDESDLDELLALGGHDAQWEIDYAWRRTVTETLIAGWTDVPKLKEACLKSAVRWETQDGHTLDREVAWDVAVAGFPGDSDVARHCAQEIRREDHPFVGTNFDQWQTLADGFRGNEELVPAIEVWAQKQKYIGPELSFAALVGRTPSMKALLIRNLEKSFPYWPAMALLEGWGIQDEDVRAALTKIALGPVDQASNVAALIPRILVDSNEARRRLLLLINDPTCNRPDFVIRGLGQLQPRGDENELTAACLQRLGDREPSGAWSEGGAAELIEYFGTNPEVRGLALKSLTWRRPPVGQAAIALANVPEARARIIDITSPLPTVLRRQIVEELSTTGDEEFALSVLRQYDVETDDDVKTRAAIGYFRKLIPQSDEATAALERVTRDIRVSGPDFEERRRAAFVGLLLLHQLEAMATWTEDYREKKPLAISLGHHFRLDTTLIRLIARHWAEVKAAFGDAAPSRLAGHLSAPFWESMALSALEFRDLRVDLLEEANRDPSLARSAPVLRLFASLEPRSESLKDICVRAMVEGSLSPHHDYESVEEAGWILADHFGGDEDTLSLLKEQDPSLGNQGVIIALCAGWPSTQELANLYESYSQQTWHIQATASTLSALRYACTPADKLEKAISEDLQRSKWPRPRPAAFQVLLSKHG